MTAHLHQSREQVRRFRAQRAASVASRKRPPTDYTRNRLKDAYSEAFKACRKSRNAPDDMAALEAAEQALQRFDAA